MPSEEGRSGSLPEELREWVERKANATGRHPTEILARAVTAYRLLEEGAPEESLEAELREQVGDVSALEDRLDSAESELSTLDDRLSTVDTSLEEFETEVREGFDNYETVVSTLDEELEELQGRTTRLANAVLELRDRLDSIDRERAGRDRLAALKREANQQSISEATCEECDRTVSIGLLERPACPFCETTFDGVEPGGWFRSATLRTDSLPALEGSQESETRGSIVEMVDEGSFEAQEPVDRSEETDDDREPPSADGFEWRMIDEGDGSVPTDE